MCSANSECRCELIIENQKSWELPIYSSNSNYLIYGMINMELPIPCVSACVPHAVIQFLTTKNTSAVEIHRQLIKVSDVMSIQMVRKWCQEYCERLRKMHDELRTGHPKVVTDEFINTIHALLNKDRCLTLREQETIMNDDLGDPLSQMSISRIVTENLQFRKVCAQWVPISYRQNTKRIARLPSLIFWSNTNVMVKKCWVGLLREMRHGCIISLSTPKRSWWFEKNPKNRRQKKFKTVLSPNKVICSFLGCKRGHMAGIPSQGHNH